MSETTGCTLGNPCPYCGLYHTYSYECCRDMQNRELSCNPVMVIPDYKDQLQQIIRLLEDIKAK